MTCALLVGAVSTGGLLAGAPLLPHTGQRSLDAAPIPWGRLEPGPYRVGLRLETLVDETRAGFVSLTRFGPDQRPSPTADAAEPSMLGEFVDDYGIEYSITPPEWVQWPGSRYRIHQWHPDDRFLVARNDPSNPSDGGLWTRIDWLRLDSGEYAWAFCYAAYRASSPEEALAAAPSGRLDPLTGCNDHPFSRMRRRSPAP